MKVKHQKFDRIYKEEAIKLSYEKKSLKEAAEELGIRPNLICRWRKEYQEFKDASFPGSGYDRIHPDDKKIFDLQKEAKESEIRYEILKNASLHLHQGKLPIYQFIKENEHRYTIVKMCEVLEVGRRRYFTWKSNGISEKMQYLTLLKKDIAAIFFRFNKHYGQNEITYELRKHGYKIGKRRVSFYMKQLGLKRIIKRKFKATTNSCHNHSIAPNLLNQEFKVNAPSKVWVSDITYIPTRKDFLYLTIIMDLYDRKIIGWSLSYRLFTKTTTIPALEMAVANRTVSKGLLFHSDRGVQYASTAFIDKLNSHRFTRSMSRKGNSYDNAVAESFFNTLKRELRLGTSKLISQKIMKMEIAEFIENFYNKKRIHSSLNYKTIEQFNAGSNSENPKIF